MIRPVCLAALLVAACAPSEHPELACQKRMVAVRGQSDSEANAPGIKADPFHAQGYSALDLKGCTAKQRAEISRLTDCQAPARPDGSQRTSRGIWQCRCPYGRVPGNERRPYCH